MYKALAIFKVRLAEFLTSMCLIVLVHALGLWADHDNTLF